jgi:biotin carboxyl carrier protein
VVATLPAVIRMPQAIPEIVCCAVPSAPSRGGGRRRRPRTALWGVAPVAADPTLWQEGAARRRLVRAATVTGVMGLAWASTSTTGTLPRPLGADTVAEDAESTDESTALDTAAVRWRAGEGGTATGESLEAAGRRPTKAAPSPRRGADEAPARRERPADADVAPVDPDAWRDHALAMHEGLTIVLPSPDVVLAGFHEASRPGARDLGLTAAPDRDLGRRPVPHTDIDDPLPTMVLPSRSRPTGSATAIDVALPAGRAVHAPVSGTVVTVEPYLLYGRYPDTRIVVRPDGRPDLRLVVLHVTGPQVAVGDRVEAGRTVLAASATPFPFPSQVDEHTARVTGRATPHVHLELRPD